MSEVRVNFDLTESLVEGESNVRANYLLDEALSEGLSKIRVNYLFEEALSEGLSKIRLNYFIVESLVPVPLEPYMSTEKFPGFGNSSLDPSKPQGLDPFNSGLPGLDISVVKKPMFNTRISKSSSAKEVRSALQDSPEWEFTLSYNYLEDSSGANSSLKSILGFYLTMLGRFDDWLFKDPDDYNVVNGTIGTADGTLTTFYFARNLGGFSEVVGQVDTDNTITLYHSIAENQTVPSSPGPYTVTVTNSASFVEDQGVTEGGSPLTRVTGSPATGEYSVDEGTGIYTFNSASADDSIVISYRYTLNPSSYVVTLPNYVVFSSAPGAGTISSDFQFFFVCRFLEDEHEYEKFLDKLWNLRECQFKSILK